MKDEYKTKNQLINELVEMRQRVTEFAALGNEHKGADGGVVRLNRALQMLSECNQALVRATEESDLLYEICKIIVEIGGYRLAWIGFAEQDEEKSVRPVAQAGYEEGYLETLNITWADTEQGRGPTGTAIRTGKPYIVKNTQTDPTYFPWRAEATKRGYGSAIALPLIDNGCTFGALRIYAVEPEAFDTEEVNLLTGMADNLAYGIIALRTRVVRKQAEDALRKNKASLADAQRIAHLGNWDWNIQTNEMWWSDGIYRIFGLTPQETDVTYQTFLNSVHHDDREAVKKSLGEALYEKKPYNIDYRIFRPDGVERMVHGHAEVTFNETDKPVRMVGTVQDLTERRRVQKALARLASLPEQDPNPFIETNLAGEVTYLNTAARIRFPDLYAVGLKHQVLEGLRSIIAEFQKGEQESFIREIDLGNEVYEQKICYVSEGNLIRIFSYDITERKRAEETLRHSLEKLRKTMRGTIEAMAMTVETRDPYTAGHQRQVAHLARAIATEMGLSEEQIEGIYMAAVIHDLGKISIPGEILSKPTRLTEIEFSMIKTHPEVGYDILKSIEFPWPVAQIVLQHHERMDGSGYPAGLAGEEIPLESRIIAVADVVEATASHRPYRPALGIDKALEEIFQNKGILYDSEVVDACLKLFTEKGFRFT